MQSELLVESVSYLYSYPGSGSDELQTSLLVSVQHWM